MRNSILILAAATSLAGCVSTNPTLPVRGVEALNVPEVSRSDYVFDAATPDGSLSATERARLDGWFSGLELGYGDSIYVDAGYAGAARADVARVAGRYGLLLSDGAPVTAGPVAPGTVRVVVSRTRAQVPGCPNWDRPASPDYANQQTPNFGCAVNGNLTAMVADPQDLVYGREAGSVVDAATAAKAVHSYRSAAPTGEKGLQDINTKKGGK
jgi:pilus assembly protein CpaD